MHEVLPTVSYKCFIGLNTNEDFDDYTVVQFHHVALVHNVFYFLSMYSTVLINYMYIDIFF